MFWQEVDIHDARVGEIRYIVDTRPVGYAGAGTHVDEDPLSLEYGAVDFERVSSNEPGMTPNQVNIIHAVQPVSDALVRGSGNSIFAGLHAAHVDGYITVDGYSKFPGLPGQVSNACTADQRFGRRAADVDAGTADQFALDDGCLLSFLVQASGKRGTGLAGADDNRVVIAGHYAGLLSGAFVLIRQQLPLQVVRRCDSLLVRTRHVPQLRREIIWHDRRACGAASVDILPHNGAIRLYLEQSTGIVFRNVGIAVRQSFL